MSSHLDLPAAAQTRGALTYEPVAYWVRAAREQSRRYVQLRRAYAAERNGRKRGRFWEDARRCRERRRIFMTEARATLARVRAASA